MKIWQLRFEVDKYDNFVPEKEFTAEEIQSFDGRSKINNWEPIRIRRMEPDKKLRLGDAPGFIFPVLSGRALSVLMPLIANSVELLDLLTEEGEYYGVNIIAILDVINHSKSSYKTYSDGLRILAFQKYSFLDVSVLEKYNIFKIVEEPTRWAFVTDEFKKTVEVAKLEGFNFKLVWDSEE